MPVRWTSREWPDSRRPSRSRSGRSPGDEKKVADQDKRQTGYDDAVARYKQRLETKAEQQAGGDSPVTIATAMSVLMAADLVLNGGGQHLHRRHDRGRRDLRPRRTVTKSGAGTLTLSDATGLSTDGTRAGAVTGEASIGLASLDIETAAGRSAASAGGVPVHHAAWRRGDQGAGRLAPGPGRRLSALGTVLLLVVVALVAWAHPSPRVVQPVVLGTLSTAMIILGVLA